MLWVHLPAVYGAKFEPFLPDVLPLVLLGLADDMEPVRDASMRAAQAPMEPSHPHPHPNPNPDPDPDPKPKPKPNPNPYLTLTLTLTLTPPLTLTTQAVIAAFREVSAGLLLPELQRGLGHENYRIRQSSAELLGDLMLRLTNKEPMPIPDPLKGEDNKEDSPLAS
eukprot:scaffold86160_cov36-Phaeocystis_antarctica.AAC.1